MQEAQFPVLECMSAAQSGYDEFRLPGNGAPWKATMLRSGSGGVQICFESPESAISVHVSIQVCKTKGRRSRWWWFNLQEDTDDDDHDSFGLNVSRDMCIAYPHPLAFHIAADVLDPINGAWGRLVARWTEGRTARTDAEPHRNVSYARFCREALEKLVETRSSYSYVLKGLYPPNDDDDDQEIPGTRALRRAIRRTFQEPQMRVLRAWVDAVQQRRVRRQANIIAIVSTLVGVMARDCSQVAR
jgi:hypothetical protein